jgi:hypothetical protein
MFVTVLSITTCWVYCVHSIDMLPDIALLESFDSYVAHAQLETSDFPFKNRETWISRITLVHVCRKWRDIVYSSLSHHVALNLRLLFTLLKSVKILLDAWPPLLIDIWTFNLEFGACDWILSLRQSRPLEHDDRIQYVKSKSFDDTARHF